MKAARIMPALAASLSFVAACSAGDATTPPATIAKVTVTASATSLAPGEVTQLTASAATTSGQPVSGAQFTWLSETPSVATVDAAGRVTAVSPGTAAVSATAASVRGVVTLTVNAPVVPRAGVRFVNATSGMTGSGGFTMNGQFASGSALASGQAAQCAMVNAGASTFGFGAANAAGTGLNGSALATSPAQSVTANGSYVVAATGPATTPTLFVLDNSYVGSIPANRAAVRFVNLAPGTDAAPNNFAVFVGNFGAGGTLHAASPEVGAPTTFTTVPSGSNVFSLLRNHEVPAAISGASGTLNLEAGTVNTIAIVASASGGFRFVNLPGC